MIIPSTVSLHRTAPLSRQKLHEALIRHQRKDARHIGGLACKGPFEVQIAA